MGFTKSLRTSFYTEHVPWILLNTSRLDLRRREKINLNFYVHTFLWCLKSFIKAFMAFIKPFEAP